jgi:predicted alpha/beta superfamily hydrolase
MRFIKLTVCLIILSLTAAAQTAKNVSGAGITGGVNRHINFPSKFVEARNIDVWLPAGYSKDKKYAVLYMHDGQNLFNAKDAIGGVDLGIDETLQKLTAEKSVRDTIVVGIWSTAHRVIEYAPDKPFDLINRKNIKPSKLITPPEGYSDKYLKFIVFELKPFIDKTYSTKTDADDTFIMGSSMGALVSLYAISEYPNVFGGAVCVSTQFPLGKGVMLGYMKKFLPSPETHKIYFDYGTESLDAQDEPFQKQADRIMKKKGYKQNKNWLTRKFPGEGHDESSWRKRADIPLAFLLKK